jgi:hypothetical protein
MGDAFMGVTVANRGLVPAEVASAAFELRQDRTLPVLRPVAIDGPQVIPAALGPGEAVTFAEDLRVLGQASVQAGGIVGVRVTTKPGDVFRCDVDPKWLAGWAPKGSPPV